MEKEKFDAFLQSHQDIINTFCEQAYALHASVGQTYDGTHPYSFHLKMVLENAMRFGCEVMPCDDDILPMLFGVAFHDSIEDARLSYNDVKALAKHFMTNEQAFTAAEIVYALTNEKGRTRAERASDRYYEGIRTTPYAPFAKLCDRLANFSYSCAKASAENSHMYQVHRREWPHFIQSINAQSPDIRFSLPATMIAAIEGMMGLADC